MTALTPEQMRALATRLDSVVRNEGLWGYEAEDVERAAAALRTAADQLEAATALTANVGGQRDYWADRIAAVECVAGMAEDDEDGNGWVRIDPLLDALYPEKRGVNNV